MIAFLYCAFTCVFNGLLLILIFIITVHTCSSYMCARIIVWEDASEEELDLVLTLLPAGAARAQGGGAAAVEQSRETTSGQSDKIEG